MTRTGMVSTAPFPPGPPPAPAGALHVAADRAALAALGLAALGLVFATSVAAYRWGFGGAFLAQAFKLVVATGVMLALTRLPVPKLRALAWPAFAASLGLVAWAAFFSPSLNGAHRWIFLPGRLLTFQPAEFAKVVLIVLTAHLAARAGTPRDFYRALLPAGLLAACLFRQPDVGTAVLCLVTAGAVLFVAGFPWRHTAVLILGLAGALVLAWLLLPHVQKRVGEFLAPTAGSQVSTALVAAGSGGLAGKGLGEGTVKLGHLPQAGNDFIFSIVGEELGLLGAVGVLALLLVFVREGFRVAGNAPDRFLGLVAFGAVFAVGFQALAHVAVNTAMAPAKGIDFPLLGSGGSSLCFALGAVGLLRAVGREGGGGGEADRDREGTTVPNVERYGVLALCFLIVVILGVSLWGPQEPGSRRAAGGEGTRPSLRETDPALLEFQRPPAYTAGGIAGDPEEARPGRAPSPQAGIQYRVRRGDVLGRIAQRFYGSARAVPAILAANPRVPKNGAIREGQLLVLPPREAGKP